MDAKWDIKYCNDGYPIDTWIMNYCIDVSTFYKKGSSNVTTGYLWSRKTFSVSLWRNANSPTGLQQKLASEVAIVKSVNCLCLDISLFADIIFESQ